MPSQILPDHPAKPKVLCLRLASTACCQQGLLHACHGLLRTGLLTRLGAVKELPVGRCQAGQRRGYDPVRRPVQVQHIAQDEHGGTERPVSSQEAQTARPPLRIANCLLILQSVTDICNTSCKQPSMRIGRVCLSAGCNSAAAALRGGFKVHRRRKHR